jgi:hypothetical protein
MKLDGLVDADLSCTPPIMLFQKIIRIMKHQPRADKSAPTDVQIILLNFIIGPLWPGMPSLLLMAATTWNTGQ